MNDLFINTTTYYVIAVIVYMFIAVNSILLNIESVRNITLDIIRKLNYKLRELKPIVDSSNILHKYLLKPIGIILIKIFEFIFFIADHIYKAEYYFITAILPELVEPINYVSLILRKCYTSSQTAVITISALFFVVFYFILSIF